MDEKSDFANGFLVSTDLLSSFIELVELAYGFDDKSDFVAKFDEMLDVLDWDTTGGLFLSNGLTRSVGLRSGFGWYSDISFGEKTLEELVEADISELKGGGGVDVSDLDVCPETAEEIEAEIGIGSGLFVEAADAGFIFIELKIEVLVSLVVLPRFLFAKSYISPNMPAKVFLKFFIVSSVSSATEPCDCGSFC